MAVSRLNTLCPVTISSPNADRVVLLFAYSSVYFPPRPSHSIAPHHYQTIHLYPYIRPRPLRHRSLTTSVRFNIARSYLSRASSIHPGRLRDRRPPVHHQAQQDLSPPRDHRSGEEDDGPASYGRPGVACQLGRT
jgi:hypothetical protein